MTISGHVWSAAGFIPSCDLPQIYELKAEIEALTVESSTCSSDTDDKYVHIASHIHHHLTITSPSHATWL